MNMRGMIAVAAALLSTCSLFFAGCGSSGSAATSEGGLSTSGLYPISVDDNWGYIDCTGTVKIQPQYESALPFTEGLAAVGLDGKFGYIDTSGTMVIRPQFEQAHPFSDGMAAVGELSGDTYLFGYIDTSGTLVIPMQYQFAPDFSEGLCLVMGADAETEKWGYIDKTGTMAIEPTFDMADDFSEGLAGVAASDSTDPHGFIDKTGDLVVVLPDDLRPGIDFGAEVTGRRGGFSEGLAIVEKLAFDDPEDPGFRYGYVDTSGKVVIQPAFSQATDFSEGLAAVAVTDTGVRKWGYIDKTGTWVIQPQYESAWPFAEGLASVALLVPESNGDGTSTSDRDWGYIDQAGAVVIPLQYRVAFPFSGGVAWVEKWARVDSPAGVEQVSTAYVDRTGRVIWQGE